MKVLLWKALVLFVNILWMEESFFGLLLLSGKKCFGSVHAAWGLGTAGACPPPSCDWARGAVHPGEGPDRERQKTTQSQIPGFKLLLFEVLIGKDTHELSHERTS